MLICFVFEVVVILLFLKLFHTVEIRSNALVSLRRFLLFVHYLYRVSVP